MQQGKYDALALPPNSSSEIIQLTLADSCSVLGSPTPHSAVSLRKICVPVNPCMQRLSQPHAFWTGRPMQANPGKAWFRNQNLHSDAGFIKTVRGDRHSQHPRLLSRPRPRHCLPGRCTHVPVPWPGQGPQPHTPTPASHGPGECPVERAAGAASPIPCMWLGTLHEARKPCKWPLAALSANASAGKCTTGTLNCVEGGSGLPATALNPFAAVSRQQPCLRSPAPGRAPRRAAHGQKP